MGCHGNRAFSNNQFKFLIKDKIFCIKVVPMNILALMKICPVVQGEKN